MKRSQAAVLALLTLLLGSILAGCGSQPQTAEAFFKGSLNFAPPANSMRDFQGERSDAFPAFLTRGSAHYIADAAFFAALTQDTKFFVLNDANRPIHETDCRDLPGDFTYWTSEPISTNGKVCYTGTFMPYRHFIIWDAATGDTRHFFDTIRQ